MKKGKNVLVLLLVLLVMVNTLGVGAPAASADSSTASLELSLPANLTDWILDEDAGYIYAISSTENTLYFIRLSDLKIEKTLNVGSNPSYIARDGHSLQVVLSGATLIKTVDLSTQQVSDTIITTGMPDSVAATSNYLFYSTNSGQIYKYDKTTKENCLLLFDPSMYSDNLALAVDEVSSTLYVGQLTSYAGITAINAETGAKLSEDIDDDMEIGGSAYSIKHIFMDEHSVYFGGHQFNKQNLTETTGTYIRANDDYTYLESVILGISDAYVLTTQGVYDKKTYMPLSLFPTNQKFALLDSKGHAYIAGEANWYDNAKKITRMDITLPQSTTALFTSDAYSIGSDQAITDWATTDNSPYIYAIVASTNELVVINKSNMSVVQKIFIGSNPTAIKIFENKAYIIFKGENHITIVDLQEGILSQAAIAKITTKHYPLDVLPDHKNRILYDGGIFAGGVSVTSTVYTSVMDAVYNEKNAGIRNPDSYILDPDQEILYGADSFSLYKFDSQNFEMSERNDIQSGYYESKLLLDDNNLYLGGRRYDASKPSVLHGTYPERVIYARGNLVFSHSSVYDRDSFVKMSDLLMFVQHAYVDDDHTLFVSTGNRLYKFHSLEELQTVMNETRSPSNAVFVDEDLTAGRVKGYLYIEPPVNQDGITGYAAYYLDQNGTRLNRLGIYKKENLSNDSLFVFEVSNSYLPAEAAGIGVYPVIRSDNYGSDGTLGVHAMTPIYDAPSYLPVDFSVTDTNPDNSIFSGTVTWKSGIAELPGVRYSLYFIGEKGAIGEGLALVNGGRRVTPLRFPQRMYRRKLWRLVFSLRMMSSNHHSIALEYWKIK